MQVDFAIAVFLHDPIRTNILAYATGVTGLPVDADLVLHMLSNLP